jgi:hypothetical protein
MGYAEHVSVDRMKEVLSYDPDTGEFRWKTSTSKKFKSGQQAGSAKRTSQSASRHVYVRVDGKDITASRAAWVLHFGEWPASRLGFKNGDRGDIRIENIYEMNSLNEEYSDKADYLRKHRNKFGKVWKETHLKRNFGISLSEYSKMAADHDHKCAICGEPEKQERGGKVKALAVDHNHATGAVRGLLCSDCNTGLGKLRDSQALLHAAIAYLDRHVVK